MLCVKRPRPALSHACLFIALYVLITINDAQAAAATSGTYKIVRAWPTGIHRHMSQVNPDDMPLCSTIAQAAAKTYKGKSFNYCPDPLPESGDIVQAKWTVVATPNAFEIATEFAKATDQRPKPDEPSILKKAMAEGAVVLESTTVMNLRTGEGTTTLLRLRQNSCDDSRYQHLYLSGTIAIAEGPGSSRITRLYGLVPTETAFTYQGRSYLLGRNEQEVDSSYKRLPRPQPQLVASTLVQADGVAAVCKVVFQPTKRAPSSHR